MESRNQIAERLKTCLRFVLSRFQRSFSLMMQVCLIQPPTYFVPLPKKAIIIIFNWDFCIKSFTFTHLHMMLSVRGKLVKHWSSKLQCSVPSRRQHCPAPCQARGASSSTRAPLPCAQDFSPPLLIIFWRRYFMSRCQKMSNVHEQWKFLVSD